MTLWGAAAEDAGGTLEGLEGTSPVLSISNCRVTDFNGAHVPGQKLQETHKGLCFGRVSIHSVTCRGICRCSGVSLSAGPG